ncbi:hypothetical protein [Chitinophaga sp. Cy-1792]|uniref:hypothetical protein n=1 Tax=Chitinophaga sp. Cy-1792 TaxID=2608339 RepID=UPI00141DEA34|nr:hypothetical protein [Chitinophaga sp. Cy-1792]NIG52058.1 hypothetical protein [Chitinophaga sp. Cy-1792]
MHTPKHLPLFLMAAAVGLVTSLVGQRAFGQGIEKAAKKVGNTTASVAVKGTSTITDKTYKGKEGPNGQVVYIDKKDRKFIVDDKGKKVYLKPNQIHDKPKKDK